jgi:hypothetical protein
MWLNRFQEQVMELPSLRIRGYQMSEKSQINFSASGEWGRARIALKRIPLSAKKTIRAMVIGLLILLVVTRPSAASLEAMGRLLQTILGSLGVR